MSQVIPVNIVIPAAVGGNPGYQSVPILGRIFTCQSSTADFSLRADSGEIFPVKSGGVFGERTSPEFGRLGFYNATANAITVTGLVSYEPVPPELRVSNDTVVINQPPDTYPVGSDIVGLSNGNTMTFTGLNAGNKRVQFIIQNFGNGLGAGALRIQDTSNRVGLVVPPDVDGKFPITFDGNGQIVVFNASGVNVTLCVLERFLTP